MNPQALQRAPCILPCPPQAPLSFVSSISPTGSGGKHVPLFHFQKVVTLTRHLAELGFERTVLLVSAVAGISAVTGENIRP